jgi:putative ubiquitin-RnfH superfamily antitoxin RatB of RatAB toxin-antitoxin module
VTNASHNTECEVDPPEIQVEVAYALPDKQKIVKLQVPAGTTAYNAVTLSQIDQHFDELEIVPGLKLGVWGKAVSADRVLVSGERVEIYRPLVADPKEVRKARAAKAKAARSQVGQEASAAISSSDA